MTRIGMTITDSTPLRLCEALEMLAEEGRDGRNCWCRADTKKEQPRPSESAHTYVCQHIRKLLS